MQLTLDRTPLFNALKTVIGVVERKNTHAILANVLLEVRDSVLTLTTSNLEMEMRLVLGSPVQASEDLAITLPARKVYDLISALPDDARVTFDLSDGHALMKVGRNRYKLSTLPAADFPMIDVSNRQASVALPQSLLGRMIKQVDFAMALQDVRYYLNGMLLELDRDLLNLVATDGHRLGKAGTRLSSVSEGKWQLIIPRRTVMELSKALGDDGDVTLHLASNHLMLELGPLSMTVKLIEGKFPDYARVIPVNQPYLLAVDKSALSTALSRASILANDKLKGVRLSITADSLELTTTNPEQDEADEFVEGSFNGPDMTTGYNLRYLQEVLAVMPTENAMIALKDGNSACLAEYTLDDISVAHVVMPMRI